MTLDQHNLPWNMQEQPLVTPRGDHLDDDPELAQALRTAVEGETALRDAEKAVERATEYLQAAQEQDALTAAKAEADGEPDPGRVGELAAEEAIANAKHRVRTLRERARSTRSAFHEHLVTNEAARRRRWLGEADDLANHALAKLSEAASALQSRTEKKALVEWAGRERGTKFAVVPTEVQRELAEVSTKLDAMALAARNGLFRSRGELEAEKRVEDARLSAEAMERAEEMERIGGYTWKSDTQMRGTV